MKFSRGVENALAMLDKLVPRGATMLSVQTQRVTSRRPLGRGFVRVDAPVFVWTGELRHKSVATGPFTLGSS